MDINPKPFCKIFTINGHQVLYRLVINTEGVENKTELHMCVFINGIMMNSAYDFEIEGEAERALASITEIQAKNYLEAMLNLIS